MAYCMNLNELPILENQYLPLKFIVFVLTIDFLQQLVLMERAMP
jgi:hypothetical protein